MLPTVVRDAGLTVKGAAMRSLLKLPSAAIRKVAGPPVVINGKQLDAEMQLILKLMKIDGPPAETLPIPAGRQKIRTDAALIGGTLPIGSVTGRTIDGPGGPLAVRIYTPRQLSGVAPALFYIHGGGWIYGDLDTHDATCRFLAEQAQVRVIAVDYRLAPESPFPAAFDDVWCTYRWILDNARGLGVDTDRLAVGGDSAGGNLAAIIAQEAVREGTTPPAFQLLIYPATDFSVEFASERTYAQGFYLTDLFLQRARENYLANSGDLTDRRASPLQHSVDGVAPAYVLTAGFDPLLDEGAAYADKLRDAGVPVDYQCEEGLIHSFANMVALGRSAPEAMRRAAAALQRGLA